MLALEGGSIARLSAGAPVAGTWMGEPELRRLASLGTALRRREFVAGRWLARGVLERQGAISSSQRVSIGAEGPPRLEGVAGLHLSLSHRRGWVVAVLAGRPVGVDMEVVRPRDVAALSRQFCSPREQARLQCMEEPEALAHFHVVWAVKEAAFKAGLTKWGPLDFARSEVEPCAAGEAGAKARGHAISWLWPGGQIISCATTGLLEGRPRVPWDGNARVSRWSVQEAALRA